MTATLFTVSAPMIYGAEEGQMAPGGAQSGAAPSSGAPITPNAGQMENEGADDRGVKDTLSDAAITTSVKTRLLANAETDGLDINVTTQNGVVTLKGEVDSEAEKTLAFQIASDTDGVRGVQDQLSIGGGS